MAVKKKEKLTQSQETPNNKSGGNSLVSPKPAKGKVKGIADNSKSAKEKKMKNADEQKEAKQKIQGFPFVQQIIVAGQFLKEVQAESRKISWPERSQVLRETISVLFLVALITFFVWSFDLLVGKFVFAPVEHWGHLYGIGGK